MTSEKDDENIGSFYMGRMRPPPEPRRVLPRGALTVMALSVFAVVIWYAYPQNRKAAQEGDVPVITADNAPYRFKPEDPGGMEVRHQDSTVFDPLENKALDKVEKLRPPAEQPMSKDKAVEIVKSQEKPAADDKPARLDLRMQMKTLPDGTEKIITGPSIKTGAAMPKHAVAPPKVFHPAQDAPAPAPKPAVAANPAPEAKTEAKTKTAAMPLPAVQTSVAATAGGVYVQLGAFRELSAARGEWAKLQKKYPQYFSGLTMRTERVDLGGKGVFNRLQAGRLAEKDAKKLCDALKAAGTSGCIVVH
jgi:cell division protein FtsN